MSEQTKFSPLLSLARSAQRRRMDMQCDPQWVLDLFAERDALRAEAKRLRPPSGHAPYPEQIKAWQEASRQDLARCARLSACIDQLTSTLEDIRSQLDAGLMPSIGAIDKALEASG